MSVGSQRFAAAVIAGAAITACALPASAGAATTHVIFHSSRPAAVQGVQVARPALAATPHTYLAGWYSVTNSGLASASSTFRIPAITCPSTDTRDLGFGVFGVPTGASNENSASQAEAQVVCEGGSALYYVGAFTLGGGNSFTDASPHDLVITSLFENGSTTVATVHDVTQGTTVTSTGSSVYDTAANTGSYNYEFPDRIPSFVTARFTKSQVNGDYLVNTATSRLNMKPNNVVQIFGGPLTATGDGFTETFNHA